MTTKKISGKVEAISEIRISVTDVAREIIIESALTQSDILARVNTALATSEAVVFDDVRGRQFLIPAEKISVIEIGDATDRKVGFTNS